ncbi:MAG: 3-alpha,7-alpha, 12-alpha-trihydroxy-5-beta-cholest-24-enoyl-CoA hydratase [Herminiimonas sp.]|nr:3-alpha,7-alpha, 12-alpha-trihydroxy-5-beta-cholest-24-enoyl-CoA hydratase [Herminiimonas sp.]
MKFNRDAYLARAIAPREFQYTERDTMLYALGVGLGRDPLDEKELAFVYENGLKVLPTQAAVIAWNYNFILGSGLDEVMVLHGEQEIVLHQPLPVAASTVVTLRVTDVHDKGAGRGAIVKTETEVREKHSGRLLCTTRSTSICRGDGGFGGDPGPKVVPHPIPAHAPEFSCDLHTRPDQPLLYRLSGDDNPLHADPAVAREAGYERPILHGLCTFGIAGHALLKTICDYDSSALKELKVRFTAPTFPGDTIRTEMWRDGNIISFRCRAVERDVVVINNGRAVLAR